jgi:hypothetical protein
MLTADDVRKALDLVPFEGFARKQEATTDPIRMAELAENPNEVLLGPRRTGRTTRMLCSLLAACSTGRRVAIYARPLAAETAMKEKAREYALRIGLNPDLILGHLATAEIEFFDHTWYE